MMILFDISPQHYRKKMGHSASSVGITSRGSNVAQIPACAKREEGQALVELSLLIPMLLLLVLMVIEGAYMFRTYTTLVSATWVGTRFALDGGTDSDIASVIQNSSPAPIVIPGRTDVYVVRGTTNSGGAIVQWNVNHVFGTGSPSPRISQSAVQAKLTSSLQPATISNVSFVLVEMDYQHTSLTGSGILPIRVPMTSYAIIQRL